MATQISLKVTRVTHAMKSEKIIKFVWIKFVVWLGVNNLNEGDASVSENTGSQSPWR